MINIVASATNEFRSLKDNELREIHRSAKSGAEAPRGLQGEQLRQLVWAAYNESLGQPITTAKPVVAKAAPTNDNITRIPLTATPPPIGQGAWPYRKRIVELQESAEVIRGIGKVFNCQGVEVGLFPRQKTAVPYMIWDRIRRMNTITESKKIVDGEGNRVNVQVDSQEPAFGFYDHGDDPETAHLPTSPSDWYKRQCISNDHYRLVSTGGRCTRDHLKRILRGGDEINGDNRDFINDRNDDELRHEILRALGFFDVIEREELELLEEAA